MSLALLIALCAVSLAASGASQIDDVRSRPMYPESGQMGVELRLFIDTVAQSPYRHARSLFASPRWEFARASRRHHLVIEPFVRVDEHDERSHVDLREAKYVGVFGPWEVRAGVDREFWGVTEAVHLVDVLNQDDALEDIDGEDKLGQPMVALTHSSRWGSISLYSLPYFRQRSHTGREGRPQPRPPIRGEGSDVRAGYRDFAARAFVTQGAWDLGLSFFSGTARDPVLRPDTERALLVAHYPRVRQLGLDLQGVYGAWLLKLEAVGIESEVDRRAAAVGVEYTWFDVRHSNLDLGLAVEYLVDSRDESVAAFENDLFLGVRLGFNDRQSTQLLAGVIADIDDSSRFLTLEGSRRLGNSFRLALDGRIFARVHQNDALGLVRHESFVQATLAWFF